MLVPTDLQAPKSLRTDGALSEADRQWDKSESLAAIETNEWRQQQARALNSTAHLEQGRLPLAAGCAWPGPVRLGQLASARVRPLATLAV
jgi:hypothetical protein